MNGQQRLELLTAALAGKTIQFQLTGSKRWQDHPDPAQMREGRINFFAEFEWRIKPDPVRLFVIFNRHGQKTHVTTNREAAARKLFDYNNVGRLVAFQPYTMKEFLEVVGDEGN